MSTSTGARRRLREEDAGRGRGRGRRWLVQAARGLNRLARSPPARPSTGRVRLAERCLSSAECSPPTPLQSCHPSKAHCEDGAEGPLVERERVAWAGRDAEPWMGPLRHPQLPSLRPVQARAAHPSFPSPSRHGCGHWPLQRQEAGLDGKDHRLDLSRLVTPMVPDGMHPLVGMSFGFGYGRAAAWCRVLDHPHDLQPMDSSIEELIMPASLVAYLDLDLAIMIMISHFLTVAD
eukprot:scaffold305129_cov31-Tisochrysis_lutea.AAC.1